MLSKPKFTHVYPSREIGHVLRGVECRCTPYVSPETAKTPTVYHNQFVEDPNAVGISIAFEREEVASC